MSSSDELPEPLTLASYTPKMGNAAWADFLQGSDRGHGVQIYTDVSELTASVSSFLAGGFQVEEPGIVVATAEHLSLFMAALGELGWDGPRLERAGLLAVADAEETLATIMGDRELPSAAAFDQVVGAMLDRFPGKRARVFGEMVDVLSRDARREAAIALEELWNDLALHRDFTLLCGYGLDVFDREAQAGTLPHVCRTHSHVLPAADPARLQRAVDQALEEVLGAAEAGKVYVVVARQLRTDRVPMAQVVLMWISENMPGLAERVLASARARYLAEPAAV
jgi:hypothetical protein